MGRAEPARLPHGLGVPRRRAQQAREVRQRSVRQAQLAAGQPRIVRRLQAAGLRCQRILVGLAGGGSGGWRYSQKGDISGHDTLALG